MRLHLLQICSRCAPASKRGELTETARKQRGKLGLSATKSLYIAALHGLDIFHATLQRNTESFQMLTQDFPWRFRNLIGGQDV